MTFCFRQFPTLSRSTAAWGAIVSSIGNIFKEAGNSCYRRVE